MTQRYSSTGILLDDHGLAPAELAERLVEARRSRTPIERIAPMSKEFAAEVKGAIVDRITGPDDPLGAYKVSMSYTWGALPRSAVIEGPVEIDLATLISPLIETELVFRFSENIATDMTIDDIVRVSEVTAGVEIADCRWEAWKTEDRLGVRGVEIEADNACAAMLVVGTEWVPATSVPLPDVLVRASLNGRHAAQGMLTHIMGHPAESVRWLAGALAKVGRSLVAGDVVTTGNPYDVLLGVSPEGGTWGVWIDGVGETSVTLTPTHRGS